MKARVVSDRLGVYEGEGDQRHRRSYERGAEVNLSKEDYDRHLAAGAVEPVDTKDSKVDDTGDQPLSAQPVKVLVENMPVYEDDELKELAAHKSKAVASAAQKELELRATPPATPGPSSPA